MDDLMAEIVKHSGKQPDLEELEQAMLALQEQMAYIYDLLDKEFKRIKAKYD